MELIILAEFSWGRGVPVFLKASESLVETIVGSGGEGFSASTRGLLYLLVIPVVCCVCLPPVLDTASLVKALRIVQI